MTPRDRPDSEGDVRFPLQPEITKEMIAAGILAADLEDFEYGWSRGDDLVRRVYLAMAAARAPSRRD